MDTPQRLPKDKMRKDKIVDHLVQMGLSGDLLSSDFLSDSLISTYLDFFERYLKEASKGGAKKKDLICLANQYLKEILQQIANPFAFEIFHKGIRSPFDYYHFGLELIRPLVDFSKSSVEGLPYLQEIQKALTLQENVILLSNHQIEPDPQAIALLLEKTTPDLAKNIIFVAGHRVITDPIAVPLSKGVNLLCIFSKNYIEHPIEQKREKQLHNIRSMQKLSELLSEGGKCIYVAPSGGRDRPLPDGTMKVSAFNENSVELFRLMALKAKTPTHFYTLALDTYHLQPPPKSIADARDELRIVNFTPIHLQFGPQIPMERFFTKGCDKNLAKAECTQYIWNQVNNSYINISCK